MTTSKISNFRESTFLQKRSCNYPLSQRKTSSSIGIYNQSFVPKQVFQISIIYLPEITKILVTQEIFDQRTTRYVRTCGTLSPELQLPLEYFEAQIYIYMRVYISFINLDISTNTFSTLGRLKAGWLQKFLSARHVRQNLTPAQCSQKRNS